MQRFFTVFILLVAYLSVLTAKATCPDCQDLSNRGASGGVCPACGATNSVEVSQGMHGLCQLLVDILNDKTANLTTAETNILSVANHCLTGQPVALNERLSNEIQMFRERFEVMQRQIERNLPEGNSERFASLFSPEDLTIFFALMEASGITDMGLDRLQKTFFIRIGWLSIGVKADLSSYDWKQLRNEKRFFTYLFYILLRQHPFHLENEDCLAKPLLLYLLKIDDKSYNSLFAPSDMGFDPYIESCVTPLSVLDMTSSWRWKWLTQYLNPQGWAMMFLQPQDWILRFVQEGRWNFLGRFYISDGTSTYHLAEPHSGIWILLALNDDQTVTLFTNHGMGMITVTENDLGSLLEGIQSTFSHSDNLTSEPPEPGDLLQMEGLSSGI
ncbi:hypothetical protein [Endozoicomonas sp. 4G]|uniref:hypothetical protein n=1 Tax=Endozoicomonas sp. 4G TaxID=2872754 RepID=UPI00207901EC|nr:hypothetical protein [Endozoicomonas sp. 4G]